MSAGDRTTVHTKRTRRNGRGSKEVVLSVGISLRQCGVEWVLDYTSYGGQRREPIPDLFECLGRWGNFKEQRNLPHYFYRVQKNTWTFYSVFSGNRYRRKVRVILWQRRVISKPFWDLWKVTLPTLNLTSSEHRSKQKVEYSSKRLS